MTELTQPKRACLGVFTADASLPPNMQGQDVCVCGLLGEAGDAHHPGLGGSEQAEVRRRYGDKD